MGFLEQQHQRQGRHDFLAMQSIAAHHQNLRLGKLFSILSRVAEDQDYVNGMALQDVINLQLPNQAQPLTGSLEMAGASAVKGTPNSESSCRRSHSNQRAKVSGRPIVQLQLGTEAQHVCMVWYGMGWDGMVWYVWSGVVWCGMVWYGMVWYGMVWYGMYGMVCMEWYGMVWCGVVWYGVVWYGVVWCGMAWYVCIITFPPSMVVGWTVGFDPPPDLQCPDSRMARVMGTWKKLSDSTSRRWLSSAAHFR